jgi:hypothetical protein
MIACAAGLALSGPAVAHHSRASYDMTQEVVFEGTVAELDWKNPHIFMTVATEGPDGGTSLQEVEVMSVSEARSLGLPREAISPGARVVVRVHPGRRGPGARAVGLDIRTADGAVYPLNTDANLSIAPSEVAPAEGLAGTWAASLESFGGLVATVPTFPYNEAGLAALQEMMVRFEDPSIAVLGICEPFPPPLLSVFPDPRTIEVSDATVALRFEGGVGLEMERVVHMDLAEHPADVAPSLMGHSIGRWEDGALVIDTAAFAPNELGLLFLPSGPDKHLIERLTLSEDRLHLEYAVTLEDPTMLTGPLTFTAIWDHRPDLELSGETCDPETARRAIQE